MKALNLPRKSRVCNHVCEKSEYVADFCYYWLAHEHVWPLWEKPSWCHSSSAAAKFIFSLKTYPCCWRARPASFQPYRVYITVLEYGRWLIHVLQRSRCDTQLTLHVANASAAFNMSLVSCDCHTKSLSRSCSKSGVGEVITSISPCCWGSQPQKVIADTPCRLVFHVLMRRVHDTGQLSLHSCGNAAR